MPVERLLSKQRSQTIARIRQLAISVVHELTPLSLPEIGRAFGRDHSTVWYAIEQCRAAYANDPGFRAEYDHLLDHLRHSWAG